MFRSSSSRVASAAISWPIDSALRPGTKLAAPVGDQSCGTSGGVAMAPLTRAKARWLLYRGAADVDVASVSIQTSTTWAAACNVVASLTSYERNNSKVTDGSSKLLSPAVLETLSLRLLQELRLGNTTTGHVHQDVVGAMHHLHRRQIVEVLNSAAAEEVDLEPKGHHYSDKRAAEYGRGAAAVSSADAMTTTTMTNSGDIGVVDDAANSSSSSAGSSFDNSGDDDELQHFSTRLALTNTGTLASNRGGPLAHKILDFCQQHHVPATPQLLSQLALLSCSWYDSLNLVRRADRILSSGAPLPVIESAMRACCETATFKRSWMHALALYNVASERGLLDFAAPSSSSSSSLPVSCAFNALSAMRLTSLTRIAGEEEEEEEEEEAEGEEEGKQHRFDSSGDARRGAKSDHGHSSSIDDTHWAWTLRLHSDAASAIGEQEVSSHGAAAAVAAAGRRRSFWLRGESGAALLSAATVSSALARNWSLALRVLSDKCDLQAGSLVDSNEIVSSKKLLLIPDADALFATLSACISAGRYKEAESVAKLMFSPAACGGSASRSGFGYSLVDVSGRVLDFCSRLLFSRNHRSFSTRLLSPHFFPSSPSRLAKERQLWTLQHCTAVAFAARCATLSAPVQVWLKKKSNNDDRNTINNGAPKTRGGAAVSAVAAATAQNTWLLAACAFAEFVTLSPVVSPRAAMLFGGGVISNADAMRRLLRYLAQDGVVSAQDTPTTSTAADTTASSSYRALPLLACAFHSMRNDWETALSLAMQFFQSERHEQQQQQQQLRSLSKSVLVASKRLLYVLRQTRGVHWAAALVLGSGIDSYDPRLRQHFRTLNEGILQASVLRSRRQSTRQLTLSLPAEGAAESQQQQQQQQQLLVDNGANPRRSWRLALQLYAQCRESAQKSELKEPMRALLGRTGLFQTSEQIRDVMRRQQRGFVEASESSLPPASSSSSLPSVTSSSSSDESVDNLETPTTMMKSKVKRGVSSFDKSF